MHAYTRSIVISASEVIVRPLVQGKLLVRRSPDQLMLKLCPSSPGRIHVPTGVHHCVHCTLRARDAYIDPKAGHSHSLRRIRGEAAHHYSRDDFHSDLWSD